MLPAPSVPKPTQWRMSISKTSKTLFIESNIISPVTWVKDVIDNNCPLFSLSHRCSSSQWWPVLSQPRTQGLWRAWDGTEWIILLRKFYLLHVETPNGGKLQLWKNFILESFQPAQILCLFLFSKRNSRVKYFNMEPFVEGWYFATTLGEGAFGE